MTTLRPFRFGINMLAADGLSAWTQTARRIEDLGYDVLMVPDHLNFLAPFPALAAAGTSTSRIRLGTYVLNAAFYNAAVLARDISSVDAITDGRLEVGLGTGYTKWEFEKAGIEYPSGGRRVDRLEQLVDDLAVHLADPETNGAAVQKPVPIMLAGNGDRMLRLAAKSAQIVGFSAISTDRDGKPSLNPAESLTERIGFARAAAGDRSDDIEWNLLVQLVVVTDGSAAASRRAYEDSEFGLPEHQFAEHPSVLVGSPEQIADKLRAIRTRTGISYFTVIEPVMDDFARVIALLRDE